MLHVHFHCSLFYLTGFSYLSSATTDTFKIYLIQGRTLYSDASFEPCRTVWQRLVQVL